MNGRNPQIKHLLILGVLVLLPALIGSFAACIHCDGDLCCDDSDCADSPCSCACAFIATSSLLTPATPVMDACGYITGGCCESIPPAPPQDLYRPPRVLACT